MAFGVVDQPSALATQVAVDRPQGSPQLASGLALKGRQQRAQALEGEPGILGLAVWRQQTSFQLS
jgi:hypothetical protein